MIDQWTDAQILALGKTDTPAKIAELEARTADRRRESPSGLSMSSYERYCKIIASVLRRMRR